MCMARALVTAKAILHPDLWTKSQLKNGFRASHKLQKNRSYKITY